MEQVDSLKIEIPQEMTYKVKEALMSINQHDISYNMSHKYRGLLIIFSHEKFDYPFTTKKYWPADTDEDVRKITKCFNSLGFEIRHYNNLILRDIRRLIWDCTREDHTDRDCLAIFVLSRGTIDNIFAKDMPYNPEEEIWDKLTDYNCPSLAGKPKLIFLQTCQSLDCDWKNRSINTTIDSVPHFYSNPTHTSTCDDFLIAYATRQGKFDVHAEPGSRWISILCKVLEDDYTKIDIFTMLTKVNRILAMVSVQDKHPGEVREVSGFNTSLTRSLIFGKK